MTKRIYYSLYDRMLHAKNLKAAFMKVKSSGGTGGVGHQTIDDYANNLDENIAVLVKELKEKTYLIHLRLFHTSGLWNITAHYFKELSFPLGLETVLWWLSGRQSRQLPSVLWGLMSSQGSVTGFLKYSVAWFCLRIWFLLYYC